MHTKSAGCAALHMHMRHLRLCRKCFTTSAAQRVCNMGSTARSTTPTDCEMAYLHTYIRHAPVYYQRLR